MRHKLRWASAVALATFTLLLTAVIVSIRSGLQKFSDEAVVRFPGDRVTALMSVVECDSCSLRDRNNAVWALGQMAEERALLVLRPHVDGRSCDHATRLCQYELNKAIRNIEAARGRTGAAWRVITRLHQPWR